MYWTGRESNPLYTYCTCNFYTNFNKKRWEFKSLEHSPFSLTLCPLSIPFLSPSPFSWLLSSALIYTLLLVHPCEIQLSLSITHVFCKESKFSLGNSIFWVKSCLIWYINEICIIDSTAQWQTRTSIEKWIDTFF